MRSIWWLDILVGTKCNNVLPCLCSTPTKGYTIVLEFALNPHSFSGTAQCHFKFVKTHKIRALFFKKITQCSVHLLISVAFENIIFYILKFAGSPIFPWK